MGCLATVNPKSGWYERSFSPGWIFRRKQGGMHQPGLRVYVFQDAAVAVAVHGVKAVSARVCRRGVEDDQLWMADRRHVFERSVPLVRRDRPQQKGLI